MTFKDKLEIFQIYTPVSFSLYSEPYPTSYPVTSVPLGIGSPLTEGPAGRSSPLAPAKHPFLTVFISYFILRIQ